MPHRLVPPDRHNECHMSVRKARTALSPSGALVRSALLSVSDGVIVLRPSGRIIDIDAHLRRRLGIAAASLSKRTLWSLVEPSHRSLLSAAWRDSKAELTSFDAVPFIAARGDALTADLRFTRDDVSGAILCALHDVSAHRRDASSLAEQNREYEELLTRVPFALYKFRRTAQGENRLEYLSPRVAEMFGIDTAPLLSDVDRVVELVHEEDRATFAQWITDPRWQDEDTSIEVRYGTPGGVRWIRLDASPHHMENGDIVWDGIAQDVTERMTSRQQLKESEERYRGLVENVAEGIWVIDRDARTTFLNQRMVEILGVPAEEVMGRPLFDFIPKEDLQRTNGSLERRRAGVRETREYTFVRSDGTKVHTSIETYPLTDGNGAYVGAVAAFTDVTASVEARERLHLRSEQHRFLAEASAKLAECTEERQVYGVIASMFTAYIPGSLVFVLKTLENGRKSMLMEIGGIRPDVLETGRKLLRFDPIGRTFENREGFYEKYCRPKLQHMVGGLFEASSGVVPKFIARKIERLLGVSHIYTAGIAEGESYVGYIDLMTPSELSFEPATVESFMHQCYLALATIAETRRANDEAARRRFHFENIIDGIVVLDEDRRVVESNQRFAHMLGYTVEEMLTKHAWDWDVTYPTRKAMLSEWPELPRTSGIVETQHRCKDGSLIDIEVVWNPMEWNGRRHLYCLCRDITERRQASVRLREELQRRRLLMDTTADGICVFDQEHRVIDANPRMCELLGYPREELLRLRTWDIDATLSEAEIRCSFTDIAHENRTFETRHRRKDGSTYDAEVSIRGTLIGGEPMVVTSTRDITARKRTEEVLRESERRFSTLFNVSPQAHALTSMEDGTFLEVIDAYLRMFGYTRDELIGRTSVGLNLWHSPAERAAMLEQLQRDGTVENLDITVRIRDGRTVPVLFSAVTITVGGTRRLLTAAIDITERKAMERSVAESERRYRTLFETMAQGVVYHDASGAITAANPAAARILGLTLDQMLGRTSMDPRWHAVRENGDPFPGEEHPAMAALRTGRPVPDTVMGVFRPDLNAYVWIVINAVPLFGPDGRTPVEVFSTLEDVTTRKRFETELRNSEERYRTVAQYTYDWEMWIGNDGTIRYISPSCERITGYTAEEITRNPSRLVSMIHPDDRDDYRRHVEDEFRDASVHAFEMRIITRSGAERWVQHLCRPIVTQDGRNLGRRVSNRDITERKMDERRLQESEERYRGIVENIHQAYYEANGRAVFTYCNPGLVILSGYSAEELYDMSSFRLVHEEDRPRVMEQYRTWKKGGTRQMVSEFRAKTKDGSVFWVEQTTHMEFERDGTFVRAFNFVKDITERKAAEEELRRSEERNRAIVSTIPDYMFVQDADGRFLDIHVPEETELVVPVDRFAGRTMDEILSHLETLGPLAFRLESPGFDGVIDDLPALRRYIVSVVLLKIRAAIERRSPQTYQYARTVNGVTEHFEALVVPFEESKVLHIIRNVTEKVAYEQTLRTMNEELENRVLSRTTELTEANRELEAFSYSVSHDLRAPLRAIDSFSAVLEEEYGGTLDDEARRLISVIRGSIRRMDQLVNGLLTLSRIGRDELRLQRVDMNGFFRAEVDAVLPPGSQHRHSVTIAPLPDCRADETLLRQAVGNLLSNAVKYSSASSNPEIFISGTVRGGMAVYTVADNGVGFDPEQGKKLFGIFQRLHTDERFKGVGVGLSIVQRVIQRLGGDITAEGRVDGGASFTFTLPLAGDER